MRYIDTSLNKLQEWKNKFFELIADLPAHSRNLYNEFIIKIKILKHNLRNLREANFSLAEYHLDLGNLNDTILRCWLIIKFINPGDTKAHNLLGITYYLKGNIHKAITNLSLAEEEADPVLKQFLNDKSPSEIPIELFAKYRDYKIDSYIEDLNGTHTKLSKLLVNELFSHVDEINADYKILDINSGVGLIGTALLDRLEKNFILTGAECSKVMKIYLSKIDYGYDDIIDYSEIQKLKEYDVIFSMLGLEYSQNISQILLQIKEALRVGALLGVAFSLSNNNSVKLNSKKTNFLYTNDFLIDQLNIADFEIISIKEVTIDKNKYIYVVCSKN